MRRIEAKKEAEILDLAEGSRVITEIASQAGVDRRTVRRVLGLPRLLKRVLRPKAAVGLLPPSPQGVRVIPFESAKECIRDARAEWADLLRRPGLVRRLGAEPEAERSRRDTGRGFDIPDTML